MKRKNFNIEFFGDKTTQNYQICKKHAVHIHEHLIFDVKHKEKV